jgi:hypothetical protein
MWTIGSQYLNTFASRLKNYNKFVVRGRQVEIMKDILNRVNNQMI